MRIRGHSLFWLSLLSFAGAAFSTVVTDVNANSAVSEKGEKSPESEDPASENACVTGAAIEDLSRQRERLEAKEKELKEKETELKALEQEVREELKKIESARSDLAKVDELKKKENEEKVAKIVETVESMSPKPAAALMASLDDALAVTAMQRLATPKLAKILNVMEPGRSSRLTELLAGVVRARGTAGGSSSRNPASIGAEGSQKASAKGGENHDGQNEQRISGGQERDSSRRAVLGSKGKGTN